MTALHTAMADVIKGEFRERSLDECFRSQGGVDVVA